MYISVCCMLVISSIAHSVHKHYTGGMAGFSLFSSTSVLASVLFSSCFTNIARFRLSTRSQHPHNQAASIIDPQPSGSGTHTTPGCCCAACPLLQVLLFNLLPPPGSPPLQPDVPGEPWVPPPQAVEVQAAVVDAIEQVRYCTPAVGRACAALQS